MKDTYTKVKICTHKVYFQCCELFVGLSRDYDPAQEELIKQDGFSVLMRTMQRGNVKLQTKAAFLIASLCSTRPSVKGIETSILLQFL